MLYDVYDVGSDIGWIRCYCCISVAQTASRSTTNGVCGGSENKRKQLSGHTIVLNEHRSAGCKFVTKD